MNRKTYLRRWEALKNERSTWLTHWRELSDQISPNRSRFLTSDRNKSQRNDKIINSTPRQSNRVLASGMMAGISSPARPWFRLTMEDAEMSTASAVRDWLQIVEDRMRVAFAKSNLYNALHTIYEDLPVYGIAALHVDEDTEDGIRAYVYPVGQYACASSARGHVDTIYRELSMTVGQLVEKFGEQRVSARVKEMHKRGDIDAWVEVLHIVEPNRKQVLDGVGPKSMPIRSVWLEMGGSDNDPLLAENGYEEMPTLVPRWVVKGEDTYGYGPGLDALGDCKALQLIERRKAQLIDKLANPPMVGPSSLRNQKVSLLPGDITYLDGASGGKLEPALRIDPQALPALLTYSREHETRIKSAFYADLWLSILESDRSNITAREVAERHEEKMLQLGPVLERLQDELLDPLIDRVFGIMLRNGQFPPPPPELQGQETKTEYISIVAQAQKLLSVTAIERYTSFAGTIAQMAPQVLDKINVDAIIDTYAESLGVPSQLVFSADEVGEMRAQREQQKQQEAASQQALALSQSAKNLAGADMEGDNALNRLAEGYGSVMPQDGGA